MFHSLKFFFNKNLKRKKDRITINHDHHPTPSYPSMAPPIQLRHVFDLIDADGDGKISPLELRNVVQKLQDDDDINNKAAAAAAAMEAEGMIREMDLNGDGLVDLDEFMNIFKDDSNGVFRESEIKEAFRVFDADENGLISAEELHRVLTRLGVNGSNCSVSECRKMIRGVDRDGDGFVNFEEF